MNNETLRSLQIPDSFNCRGLAKFTSEAIRAEKMALSRLELIKLHKINEVLNHPGLSTLVEEGKITLAMIKPQANESKGLSDDDQTAADLIKNEIGEENIVFSFSIKFSPADVQRFYQGNPHVDTISRHFEKGAATFILIHREQGDAVSWWRERIGATKPENADPNSIRGKHALTVSNNLVHGSDSKESVQRELNVLRSMTVEMEEKSVKTQGSFPSERCFSDFLIEPGEQLLAIERKTLLHQKFPDYVAIVRGQDKYVYKRRLNIRQTNLSLLAGIAETR